MSPQPEMAPTPPVADLDRNTDTEAERIAAYLRTHPDFFAGRDALLLEMNLGFDNGEVFSLHHRQLALLRQRSARLETRLAALMHTAESNARLADKLQLLAEQLIRAPDSHSLRVVLDEALPRLFDIDRYRLYLQDDPLLPNALPLLEGGQPTTGRLSPEERTALFGEDADRLNSTALIPLRPAWVPDEPPGLGLLALARTHPDGFNPDQGTHFLARLGQLVSVALERLRP